MEKIMIDITAITSTSDYVAFGGKLCRSKRISKPERCKKINKYNACHPAKLV